MKEASKLRQRKLNKKKAFRWLNINARRPEKEKEQYDLIISQGANVTLIIPESSKFKGTNAWGRAFWKTEAKEAPKEIPKQISLAEYLRLPPKDIKANHILTTDEGNTYFIRVTRKNEEAEIPGTATEIYYEQIK